MFSAVTADGRLIQLAGSYSKEKAAELRKKRWFCPVCKSELDIKLGREKLPHFAHKKAGCVPGNPNLKANTIWREKDSFFSG